MPEFPIVEKVTIPTPTIDKAPLELIQTSYEHEQFISENIHKVYMLAMSTGSCATVAFILPFATEQVEEEKTVQDWVNKLDLADGNQAAILLLDKEIGG
jgi:ferritin